MSALNHEVANKLREIAELLRAQKANPFRANAYLHAADTLDSLGQSVADLIQAKGIQGLVALPGIGEGIARSIYEYVATGRMSRLENLKGASDPVELFRSIPTVGRALAERIHDSLHVDSLEALENAVHDGRLGEVEGLGDKRREAIEAWLQKHLDEQRRAARPRRQSIDGPTVALLLRVDQEYRKKSASGKLPLITPKRFNPQNKAWLPILHTTHDHWHFTALYSNTARAHELGRTHDWVVIYFYDDHHREGQHTVVTEIRGKLAGERVVRGRESESWRYYESTAGA
ncbi:MAG: DNA-binding protein [Gammaproteobacteria bacterium]|nr:MAG: DNA-binding protein [Gammaproteobacteria bacterium]UCH40278.1 MAG: DNA-binding protein [Gammaproteobacteria bacterium]